MQRNVMVKCSGSTLSRNSKLYHKKNAQRVYHVRSQVVKYFDASSTYLSQIKCTAKSLNMTSP